MEPSAGCCSAWLEAARASVHFRLRGGICIAQWPEIRVEHGRERGRPAGAHALRVQLHFRGVRDKKSAVPAGQAIQVRTSACVSIF